MLEDKKVIKKDEEERKLWLIAMNIDNLRTVINGYLDDIKYLYSAIPYVIDECIYFNVGYKDSVHLKNINTMIEKNKKAIIEVLSNNLKTDWGDATEKVGEVTVGRGLSLEDTPLSIAKVPTGRATTQLKESSEYISGIKVGHPTKEEMSVELDTESDKDYGCKCGCDHKDHKKD